MRGVFNYPVRTGARNLFTGDLYSSMGADLSTGLFLYQRRMYSNQSRPIMRLMFYVS